MTPRSEKTPAPDCLCIGILVADLLCEPIERLPRPGELVPTPRIDLCIGGCAANVAFDLRRLGVSAAVTGAVGDDIFGRFLIDSLRAAGVDVRDIHAHPGARTSATLIVNVRDQDRRFIHAVGANARLAAADIPHQRALAAKVLYVGGYLLLPGLEGRPLAELFAQARAAGVRTVLDVVLPGPGDHAGKLDRVLAETDVFLPNEDEAAALSGLTSPREQAQHFVDRGAKTVVITRGGQGCVAISQTARWQVGVYPAEFQGGTGAGDAFDAGYIFGLLEGHDLVGCLQWASALGASCVRSTSATESVFTQAEAGAMIARHSLPIEPF